jgi:predicted phosphodiesterase
MGLFSKKKPFFAKCRPLEPEVVEAYGGTVDRRVAIFGDIHANLEALEAVLADAKGEGIANFACTGDLVGYCANPSECLEIVKALNCPVVKGNHDEYAATDVSLKDFTLHAMNALIWTREHLNPEERAWLDALPMQTDVLTTKNTKDTKKESGGTLGSVSAAPPEESLRSPRLCEESINLVHSSMFEPQSWKYIIKQSEAEKVLPMQKPDVVFFGHTHVPSSYAFHPDSGEFKSTVPMTEGVLELDEGWKWLLNPGSVGQPRDHDPRAAYLIYYPNSNMIEFRRVEYDFRKTAKKIVEAGLPDRNAQRLYKGR